MDQRSPKRRISPWDLKRLFNEGDFDGKVERGELTSKVVRRKPLAPDNPNIGKTIPLGSFTEKVAYYDLNNNEVAEAHRYVSPTGDILASKKNDPKHVIINGVPFHQASPGVAVRDGEK